MCLSLPSGTDNDLIIYTQYSHPLLIPELTRDKVKHKQFLLSLPHKIRSCATRSMGCCATVSEKNKSLVNVFSYFLRAVKYKGYDCIVCVCVISLVMYTRVGPDCFDCLATVEIKCRATFAKSMQLSVHEALHVSINCR